MCHGMECSARPMDGSLISLALSIILIPAGVSGLVDQGFIPNLLLVTLISFAGSGFGRLQVVAANSAPDNFWTFQRRILEVASVLERMIDIYTYMYNYGNIAELHNIQRRSLEGFCRYPAGSSSTFTVQKYRHMIRQFALII